MLNRHLIFLICGILSTSMACQTPGGKAGNGGNEAYVEDKETGLMKNTKWGSSLKEGWVDDNSVQALISSSGAAAAQREALANEAKERLAWLLLLDSYDLQRSDQPLAERLARSRIFKDFGSEQVFQEEKSGKAIIIVKKTGATLRKDWKNIMQRMETKEPRLVRLRRSK